MEHKQSKHKAALAWDHLLHTGIVTAIFSCKKIIVTVPVSGKVKFIKAMTPP